MRSGLVLCSALIALMLAPKDTLAMSGTSQVAWPDEPVKASADWPAGALELINDPLRTKGWNPWFSEWPNDVNHYAFMVTNSSDVNRLIRKLADIEAGKRVILLDPEQEPRSLGFTTVLPENNGVGVLFSIGSQQRIDEWFQHLPEVEPGVRKFGVHRFKEPPAATPPTLTLHVSHTAIDLKKLEIPSSIEVAAIIPPVQSDGQPPPQLREIESFVAKHRAKSSTPTEKQKESDSR